MSWLLGRHRLWQVQRTRELTACGLDAGLGLDHPVALAAHGGQRAKLDSAASAVKCIRQLTRERRGEITIVRGDDPCDRNARGLTELSGSGDKRVRCADLVRFVIGVTAAPRCKSDNRGNR